MQRACKENLPLHEGRDLRSRTSLFAGSVWLTAWLSMTGACATPEAVDFDGAAKELPPGTEFTVSGGRADLENRYRTVVLISSERGLCSGVLVAPKLALTAAHCLCLPVATEPSPGFVDSASCAKDVTVAAHLYKAGTLPDSPIESNARLYQGVASAYPGFKAELRKEGVASFEGDLAVVLLAQPVQGVRIDSQLPKAEVAIDESLTMVGYGDTQHRGADSGHRRFGRNVVTNIQLAAGGNGAFAFRALGAHTHEGDSGGPCFRESRSGRWLVGINMGSANSGTISLFTSTFHYRAWIADQISAALRD